LRPDHGDIIENSEHRLRELSARGERILGYAYPHAPLELLLGHGIIPSLVWADPNVRGGFEASLQTFSCSLSRNLFSQRSNGGLSYLSGLLFPGNACDSLQNVADVWRRRFPEDRIFRLTYPAARFDEDSIHFLAEELRILSESLKDTYVAPLSKEKLQTAVLLVNSFRDAAQMIYSCRILDPSLVSYSELARMVREFLTIPNTGALDRITESARVASQKLGETGQLTAAKSLRDSLLSGTLSSIEISVESKIPRILVIGGMTELEAIASLFKNSARHRGELVVLDLLSYGFKTVFTPAAALQGDVFLAIARSILGAPSEPTHEGLPERLEFLKQLLSRLRIDGLVICEQSFCDPDEFEAPSLVNAASEVGVRSVRLPMDPELSDRARLEGRIQSFIETLEGGPS
jgi:benzoyl-CoA reductase/2-hydroxyglutaryl-CoA dehydratase subunit BcrC/BadD/HgdB